MKMYVVLLLCVLFGPLLCDEKTIVGFRLSENKFKGLFAFHRAPETEVLIQILLWGLCVAHVIITWVIRQRNLTSSNVLRDHVVGNRFNDDVIDSLGQLAQNSAARKTEVAMSLKRRENCAPMSTTRGLSTKLNSHKLEMLIWMVLHDMLSLENCAQRFFSFESSELGPVYTVQNIIAGTEEGFNPSQEFLEIENLDTSGEFMASRIEPLKHHEKAKSNAFHTSKERMEDITEMVLSMFAPHVEMHESDKDWEDSVCSKIKHLSEEREKTLRLPPGGYEEAMQMKFEGESALFSNETADEMKRTLKAYYMLAGGFTRDFQRLSEELREREELIRILHEQTETRDSYYQDESNVLVNETIETAVDVQEFGRFINYTQPAPTRSYGQFRVEEILLHVERENGSRSNWRYIDYTKATIGCGALALVLFGAYRFIRR